jgi:hypothetical protein
MKEYKITICILVYLLAFNISVFSQKIVPILHDKNSKTVTLSDNKGDLIVRLNYSKGCILDKIIVNGTEVTGDGKVVYSGIRLGDQLFSSQQSYVKPVVIIKNNLVYIDSIKFGNASFAINEKWIFRIDGNNIQWQIDRQYLNDGTIEENYFPCWQFNSSQIWDGALLDNGGVALNRFLGKPGDTYGVNTSTLTFWNRVNNSCLRISPDETPEIFRTATFRHQKDHVFSVVQSSSKEVLKTKYGFKRFLQTGQNVFAPFGISKSEMSIHYTLQALPYDREYDRGVLKGIDEESVIEMLNTIGRYGVVDKNLYGSNGWRTGYCLTQEPWFALFGIAVYSPDFLKSYTQTLEFQKEKAILPDGRVLPRWCYAPGDEIPGTYDANGFYECQWGFTLDSQPCYAINVAEQFDMTGDLKWLHQFKPVCEKVLDYMIQRDTDGNGLFEVVQNTHLDQKGTDWLDVIWASYEVASINAYMYKALTRWSELEKLLGDDRMSERYRQLAIKIKTAYNKNITDGGFWDPDKGWYVHWREKDGSVYGNNLVSMVNLMAIGYGICDDPGRKDAILSKMEKLMQKEDLLIWPSCFFPYEDNVGLKKVNYPYPNYENGDMFLGWAELGTRCYAENSPEIALKYIQKIISQYKKDGLGYQRYSRLEQTGTGEDILSSNIMAIVGLYRNIYGIRPHYNRLYLEPHLTKELNGTQLKYKLRNQNYLIDLSTDKYCISINNFSVSNKYPFAINSKGYELEYFDRDNGYCSLKILSKQPCSVNILSWGNDNMSWEESGKNPNSTIHHELFNLKVNAEYQLMINGKPTKIYTVDQNGTVQFDYSLDKNSIKIQMVHKY